MAGMSFQQLLPIIAPLFVLQLILMVVSLIDLSRREADRVRGPKWIWYPICILVATVGPIIYFVIGRKD